MCGLLNVYQKFTKMEKSRRLKLFRYNFSLFFISLSRHSQKFFNVSLYDNFLFFLFCTLDLTQIRPPRDAPISWYTSVALEKMKKHGAIYLTPFSHRLAEEIDNAEYQRLRCRVNYHALRFKPLIMKLSQSIVDKLRSQGHFMSIHLRFEMDMLAFAG